MPSAAASSLFASELTALLAGRAGAARARPDGGRRVLRARLRARAAARSCAGVRQLPPGAPADLGARAAGALEQRYWWAPPERRRRAGASRSRRSSTRRSGCSRSSVRGAADRRRPARRVPQRRRRLDARRRRRAREASSQPVKTFTVGYDVGDVNETDAARARRASARHRAPRAHPQRGPRSATAAPALLARPRPAARRPGAGPAARARRSSRAARSPWPSAARAPTSSSAATRATAGSNAPAGSSRPCRRRPARCGGAGRATRRRWSAAQRLRRAGSRPAPCSSATSTGSRAGADTARQPLRAALARGRRRADPRPASADCGELRRTELAGPPADAPRPGRTTCPTTSSRRPTAPACWSRSRSARVYLQRELAEFAASTDSSLHLGGRGQGAAAAMLPPGMLHRADPAAAARPPSGSRPRTGCAARSRRSCATRLGAGRIYHRGLVRPRRGRAAARTSTSPAEHDHSDVLWPLLALGPLARPVPRTRCQA